MADLKSAHLCCSIAFAMTSSITIISAIRSRCTGCTPPAPSNDHRRNRICAAARRPSAAAGPGQRLPQRTRDSASSPVLGCEHRVAGDTQRLPRIWGNSQHPHATVALSKGARQPRMLFGNELRNPRPPTLDQFKIRQSISASEPDWERELLLFVPGSVLQRARYVIRRFLPMQSKAKLAPHADNCSLLNHFSSPIDPIAQNAWTSQAGRTQVPWVKRQLPTATAHRSPFQPEPRLCQTIHGSPEHAIDGYDNRSHKDGRRQ